MNVSKPSLAVVAAVAVLVAALGGGVAVGAALPKNSVGSKQIKTQAVKSADLKNDGVTGKDVKESSLGKVPLAANVDGLVALPRVVLVPGDPAVQVAKRGPFTITLNCLDTGGGNLGANLLIATSVNNSAYVSNLFDDADFDIADGVGQVMDAGGAGPHIEEVRLSAVSPTGETLTGYGYLATDLANSNRCTADLTFLG